MFIVAAAVFLFGHPAFAAFVIITAVKFHAGFFTHAVVYLHSNTR